MFGLLAPKEKRQLSVIPLGRKQDVPHTHTHTHTHTHNPPSLGHTTLAHAEHTPHLNLAI